MTSPVHHGGSGRRTTPFLSARSPVFGVRLAADDQPENAGRASAILGHGGFARVSGTAAAYQQTGRRTALKFFGAFRALRALTLLNSSQDPGSGFTKRLNPFASAVPVTLHDPKDVRQIGLAYPYRDPRLVQYMPMDAA